MEDSKDILIKFIREEIGEFKIQINSSTQIEEDLGVTGDEAIELIQNIARRFNIDISGFDYRKYFHPEPTFFSTYGHVMPLSIHDIEMAIASGRLV